METMLKVNLEGGDVREVVLDSRMSSTDSEVSSGGRVRKSEIFREEEPAFTDKIRLLGMLWVYLCCKQTRHSQHFRLFKHSDRAYLVPRAANMLWYDTDDH